jgi:hypothetical protein
MTGHKDHFDETIIREPFDIDICRQTLFCAAFVSIGENLLDNKLAERLTDIPGINSGVVKNTGATDMLDLIGNQYHT